MGRLQPVAVQHAHRVLGHVIQGVGVFGEVEAGGLPGVAIVVADDEAALVHQPLHKAIGPVEALGACAHYQQQWNAGWVAEALRPKGDAVGLQNAFAHRVLPMRRGLVHWVFRMES